MFRRVPRFGLPGLRAACVCMPGLPASPVPEGEGPGAPLSRFDLNSEAGATRRSKGAIRKNIANMVWFRHGVGSFIPE